MSVWGCGKRPVPQASTKLLPGFAISLAQKFAVSYEHILGMLAGGRTDTFRVDLLTGTIEPVHFNIRRNRILVEMIRDNYFDLMHKFPHITMTKAVMTTRLLPRLPGTKLRAEVRLVFRSDDGREWHGGIADYFPPRETPPRPIVLKGPPPVANDDPATDMNAYRYEDVTIQRLVGSRSTRPSRLLTRPDASARIAALRALARGVAARNPACQPTALEPIDALSRGLDTHWRFCRHLLALSLRRIKRGESAGPADVAFKLEIMRKTVALLDIEISQSRPLRFSEVAGLSNRIWERYPGHRRLSVRATRRNLPDRDLRLAALALQGLDEEALEDEYAVACVYTAWQSDLRLRFTPDSAARIDHVADFWRQVWQIPEA